MSDYYFIEGNKDGDEYRIVFHIPVPNEMNKANTINLRAALAEDAQIKKASIIPWIGIPQQTKLNNGEIIEIVESFRTNPSNSMGQNRRSADNRFKELKGVTENALKNRYCFWRFDRNVPNEP